jgi:predicted RNA-binding protein
MNYWLAVAGDTNCDILARMGYPYYALRKLGVAHARTTAPGDRCLLYRARKDTGFIGVFELTAPAAHRPTKVGLRTFAIRLDWKAIALSEDQPVRLPDLTERLSFIRDKAHWSAYLRMSFRPIPEGDFRLIAGAVETNARDPGRATRVAR